MSSVCIVRPVVRAFVEKFANRAATYVRAGGHAVVWESETRGRMVFPAPCADREKDFGYWSLLDLGKSRMRVERTGIFEGLVTSLVPSDAVDIVRDRCTRDAIYPGPTLAMDLDCTLCGACCSDNRIELDAEDIDRFHAAHRHELTKWPYAKQDDGVIILRLLRNRDCRHLRKGPVRHDGSSHKSCSIYSIRPTACRIFPMGSECCISARAEVQI